MSLINMAEMLLGGRRVMVGEAGERLKYLRESHGFSTRVFGEKIGYSHTHISRLERGLEKNPSIDFLLRATKAFKMNLCDLMVTLGYTDFPREEERAHPQLVGILGDLPFHDQLKLARILRSIREIFAE